MSDVAFQVITPDFRDVIEGVRLLAMPSAQRRRVRILAIARIADRRLNNTPQSISANETYFMRPLLEASHPVQMGKEELPAMIQPPADGDITIIWTSKTDVSIAITARPYNCPKRITVYLGLDLSNN